MVTAKKIEVTKYECRHGHIHNDWHSAIRCSQSPTRGQAREFEQKVCSHCLRQRYSPEFGDIFCTVTHDEQGYRPTATPCMKFNEDSDRVECDEYIPGGQLYRKYGGKRIKPPKESDVCSKFETDKRKGKTVGLSIVGFKEYRVKP